MAYERERATAIQAVLRACRLCRTVADALVSEETLAKKDKSPVTVADFGSQAVIIHDLLAAFPSDPIVGEEDAGDLRMPEGDAIKNKVVEQVAAIVPGLNENSVLEAIDQGTYTGGAAGRFWTLDPIDGTKGFLRGDQYAVALALIEDGVPVLGVLGCPNLPVDPSYPQGGLGCLFIAVKDQGAVMQPIEHETEKPIAVTDVADPAQAAFCESVESGHSSHNHSAQVAERLGVKVAPYRIDSQAKYAAVSRGNASVYLRLPTRADYQEKIWDHAAGWRVVQEAGGLVTDVTGKPLDFSLGRTLKNNKGVVATNGKLHDQVISAVRAVLGY